MIQITAIKQEGGRGHEHISAVQWRNTSNGSIGQSTRQAIVDWLSESRANQAVVADGAKWVYVAVVQPANQSAYIRTHADGKWSDNLLALPSF
jgi:hypothetical protein